MVQTFGAGWARRIVVLLLVPLGLNADFQEATISSAIENLDAALSIPVMQSSILQDGIQSQFLFNNSDVFWGRLEGLMFAQSVRGAGICLSFVRCSSPGAKTPWLN